jgi:hypothetical protein
MTGVGLRRPSRVVGIDHDSHPGLIGFPGSQSILAALPDPLDLRSPAREAEPQPCLPGCPIREPGRDSLSVCFSAVSARQTPRCFERGLFLNGGCAFERALNFSATNGEFGDYVRGGCAEGSPCVGGSLHPLRMEAAHGKSSEVRYAQK